MIHVFVFIYLHLNMQNNRVVSSSDEDYVNEYGCVKDDRFDVLSIDSLYCDLDNINTSLETLTRSKYCVLTLIFIVYPASIISCVAC